MDLPLSKNCISEEMHVTSDNIPFPKGAICKGII